MHIWGKFKNKSVPFRSSATILFELFMDKTIFLDSVACIEPFDEDAKHSFEWGLMIIKCYWLLKE